jgi:cytochrome c oxidase cbb3-type subunit II
MRFTDNHKMLFRSSTLLFCVLTLLVAVIPSLKNANDSVPLPGYKPLTKEEQAGKLLYIQNGCVSCHTQQVRDVDMDKMWGKRPGIAADYAGSKRISFWINSANLMGTERTGPDLVNVGNRQSSKDWNLLHLFNPRSVQESSIMPAFPWMFEIKDKADAGDVIVNVPAEFLDGQKGVVVARQDALNLVAYIQSLKQVELPDGAPVPQFLYKQEKKNAETTATSASPGLDAAALYATNCQSCHQANGEGLKGAFPPIKGSKIVLDDNPEIMVGIIMQGYNTSQGYGIMPPIGTTNGLKPEEVTAIMNYEKTSWGNNAKTVTVDQVKKILDVVKTKATAK